MYSDGVWSFLEEKNPNEKEPVSSNLNDKIDTIYKWKRINFPDFLWES